MRRTVHLAQCYRCRRMFDPRGKRQRYCSRCTAEIQRRYGLSGFASIPWGPLILIAAALYLLVGLRRDPAAFLLALLLVGGFAVYRLGRR